MSDETAESSRLHAWVARRCSPRSAMMAIVMATTTAGALSSFGLLHLGVSHFALRYALAVSAAYGTMLGLIALYSRYEARRFLEGARPANPSAGLSLDGGNLGFI